MTRLSAFIQFVNEFIFLRLGFPKSQLDTPENKQTKNQRRKKICMFVRKWMGISRPRAMILLRKMKCILNIMTVKLSLSHTHRTKIPKVYINLNILRARRLTPAPKQQQQHNQQRSSKKEIWNLMLRHVSWQRKKRMRRKSDKKNFRLRNLTHKNRYTLHCNDAIHSALPTPTQNCIAYDEQIFSFFFSFYFRLG